MAKDVMSYTKADLEKIKYNDPEKHKKLLAERKQIRHLRGKEKSKSWNTRNPEKASRDLKRKLMMAVNQINASNNEAIKKKVRLELERLNAAGGISKIAPEEGITFFIDHKGEKEFVKLTGTFAPLNQIIGLTYRL